MKIKIVADETPDADGEWIEIAAEVPKTTSWIKTALELDPFIPKGYHLVSVSSPIAVPRNRFSGLEFDADAG